LHLGFDSRLVRQSFAFTEHPEVHRYQEDQIYNSNLDFSNYPTPPHSPQYLGEQYGRSGSPFSNTTSERLFVSAADSVDFSSHNRYSDTPKPLRDRLKKGVPCPFKKHGCQSSAPLTTLKGFKKHLQSHGIGDMFQCINDFNNEVCAFTTHSESRMKEHCKGHTKNKTEVNTKFRKLFRVFPSVLRCEKCSEAFIARASEDTTSVRRKATVTDSQIDDIPVRFVASLSSSESALMEWFTHVLMCDGALSEDDLPGDKSFLFLWAEWFKLIFKAPGSDKYCMTFGSKSGRSTKESHQISQLMYAKIITHSCLANWGVDGGDMSVHLPELQGTLKNADSVIASYNNMVEPVIGKAIESNIPLSVYLKQSLPDEVYAEYIERARSNLAAKENIEMALPSPMPSSPEGMASVSSPMPPPTPALTYSQTSTPASSHDLDDPMHPASPYVPPDFHHDAESAPSMPAMEKSTFDPVVSTYDSDVAMLDYISDEFRVYE